MTPTVVHGPDAPTLDSWTAYCEKIRLPGFVHPRLAMMGETPVMARVKAACGVARKLGFPACGPRVEPAPCDHDTSPDEGDAIVPPEKLATKSPRAKKDKRSSARTRFRGTAFDRAVGRIAAAGFFGGRAT
jgi:hypothetical protein